MEVVEALVLEIGPVRKNESALNTSINLTGKQSITEEIQSNAICDNLKRADFSDKHLKESKVKLGEEETQILN